MLCNKELFLLKGLSETDCAEIISNFSKPKSFKKGEIIYSAHQFPTAIGFIVNGEAIAVANNGDGIFMNTFENSMCFGVAAIFGGGEDYVSTVIAKTDVEVIFVTEDELKTIFLKYPITSLNYIEFLSNKVRFLNKKLGFLSCTAAEDTVFKYLTSVADDEGFAQTPKSMTLLSKMLGLSRATLYRCLDTLTENKKILRENNKIKVIKNEKIS